MRSKWIAALSAILVLSAAPVAAQWGNRSAQEKGDVLGRDLAISPITFFGHTAIFSEYASGDPSDRTSSDEIEMLGPTTNAIVTQNVQAFISASLFRGAFRYLTHELTWQERRDVVDAITAMKNRPTPIDYVSFPYYNKYLTWTNRDGNSQVLTLNDIDRMRSDAVVEFAYASKGFPIVRPNLYNTIINSPDLFQAIASSNALIFPTANGLIPMHQLYFARPAFIDLPQMTIFDANNVPIASGGASSMTTISVYVSDQLSGPGGLELIQNGSVIASNYVDWDENSHLYASADIAGLAGLADGQYTLRAIDQASNYTSDAFTIDTTGSSPGAGSGSGASSSTAPITNNQCVILRSTNTISGICKIWSEFSPSTAVFAGGTPKGTYALSVCGVSTGTYIVYAQTCAGVVSSASVVVSSAPVRETLSGSGASWSSSHSVDVGGMSTLQSYFQADTGVTSCDVLSMTANGQTLTCQPQCGGCVVYYRGDFGPPAQTFSWSVTNVSLSSYTSSITFGAGVSGYNNQIGFNWAPDTGHELVPGGSLFGEVTIPEVANATYTYTKNSSTLSVSSPYSGVILSTRTTLTGAEEFARLRQVLRRSGHIVEVAADGGAALFNSTMTLRLEYVDASIDTTTARLYRLDGSSWESSSMFNQTFSLSSNIVTAVGLSTFTSTFVVFFDGQDVSAPITTFAIQGSSFVFDGTLFISTDAYVVLTATDPAESGYASTVASVTYRIDPSIDSPFYIYSSSIPLSLGTHVFEYRSLDYAGNAEATETSTFTVTAGTAFRTANTARVPGVLLNGFLGSGAKLEIESQAQNSLTLLISSVNRQGIVAVDNIGEVGIGVMPQSNLNVGVSSIAVQLRTGNSTSAVTSNQIAFGYNGDSSMRHLLRTEHSTATYGNKLDFLVWNTGAASTAAVAGLNVLSLQGIAAASGGSFHVQPAGEPDAEVEVSNGLSTGGGTMQRLQWVLPSSRRFKTDIKDLSAKDADRALADVAGLKHARFRYKSQGKNEGLIEDAAQPLRTGLIYEEAPASIRDGNASLSTGERLVNVELALKASIRRLEDLQARYERMKARRKP